MILITAATEMELAGLRLAFSNRPHVSFLVTGIGMFSSAVNITKALLEMNPTLFINVGIAGAYPNRSYHIGDIVQVNRVINPELGYQEKSGQLISFFDEGMIDANAFPYNNGHLINDVQAPHLPSAISNCVHITTGELSTVKRRSMLGADIEDMESSAIFYSCLKLNVPFHCIRAISNMVTTRNKSAWKIDDAINAYTNYLASWKKN